jgi:hypothetical protein
MYAGLHVKYRLFLPDVNVAWISWTDLEKFSNILPDVNVAWISWTDLEKFSNILPDVNVAWISWTDLEKFSNILPDVNVAWISWTDLEKFSNITFQQSPSNGNQVVACSQTDGRTDRRTTNLIVIFRNSAKAPKHVFIYTCNHPLYSAVHPFSDATKRRRRWLTVASRRSLTN